MSVILSAVFIFIFRVVLTVPVNQTSRARWCRNQGHFSNSWILPMHFFTAVCRCQCFIGHDSRTACRCRHCSVQLTSYFDHGLCGSNKLLYKRCAKSMGRPKFRPPPLLPHFSTDLNETPNQETYPGWFCLYSAHVPNWNMDSSWQQVWSVDFYSDFTYFRVNDKKVIAQKCLCCIDMTKNFMTWHTTGPHRLLLISTSLFYSLLTDDRYKFLSVVVASLNFVIICSSVIVCK